MGSRLEIHNQPASALHFLRQHRWVPVEVCMYVCMYVFKIWNASRICVSSLRRGHANLLCIVPILVYVLPK